MAFKRRLWLFPLLLGLGLAVGAAESSPEAAATPESGEEERQGKSQAPKPAEEDSPAGLGTDFTPFTPSEELLTDRPAAFPADI